MNEALLVDELRRVHGAHTVLLYGSHVRGDATPESDIDVSAYTDAVAAPIRDARRWQDTFLDGFVYPTVALSAAPDVEALRLRGARVLLDERGLAGALLDALDALHTRGPTPLAPDDRAMRITWAHKTLARIGRADPEAHYRRHQLVFELFPDYYALRNRWFPGPKQALADLARTDLRTHAIVVAAFTPDASLEALAAYVAHVYDGTDT